MNRVFYISLFFILYLGFHEVRGQASDRLLSKPLSDRNINYDIKAKLDEDKNQLQATQTIYFTNHSPVPIQTLQFYMYLNAFKHTETSFLKGVSNIFGQSFTDRKPSEWGWVHIESIQRGEAGISEKTQYVQYDDGNIQDESVLEVRLERPILPGEKATFYVKWKAQIPKTIARSGHSRDFYFMCHWFPQLGVFQPDDAGVWGWNCHQFVRQNEFYADFGVYNVEITLPEKFVVGASGFLAAEKKNTDGTITRNYVAEDVIDFAWSAYPDFQVLVDKWKHVDIRLLVSPEHKYMGKRYLHAVKFALEYLEKHVGSYPYPYLTIVDPPLHGLRSGMMEYPTLITTGTIYGTPSCVRYMESLVIHEFTHQYFMQMLASNEKEEPWLDEGFVTYFEDRIIDSLYGKKTSLVDIGWAHYGSRELSRLEYTRMRNVREGAPARPGKEFNEGGFKPLIYSKTATTLSTLEQMIGQKKMDTLIHTYFEKWKFKHPKGNDFLSILKEQLATLNDTSLAKSATELFINGIYGSLLLDYSVIGISSEKLPEPQGIFGQNPDVFEYKTGGESPKWLSSIQLSRNGDWIVPVEVVVIFEDGKKESFIWDGKEGIKIIKFTHNHKVISAYIDPNQKISLDINLNNNSMTLKPERVSLWKYALKGFFWVQNLLQALTFLS